ncbi:hypothetical protein GVX76_09235 [[Haemophilus] felis]|nr:hypothetical protein [[Haemophilus] felis]
MNAQSRLQSLNRDTKNANQKVTQHDLNEIKETQELVRGIGEIADKAMQIYTHNEREKLEQAKLELGRAKAQNASEKEITELNNKLNDLHNRPTERIRKTNHYFPKSTGRRFSCWRGWR